MQISAENLQEELDLRHVENCQIKKELEKLIQDYKPKKKTASTDVTMRIILKDEEPVCQHPRQLAFTERQEVNKQIEEWLNEGIIRPSSSEYASPIVMVKKKDGSSRMCIDYRKLNQKLVKDKFPLPIIEESRSLPTLRIKSRRWKVTSRLLHVEKLKQQQKTFGNPIRIIYDRGSAFTSKLFNDYCDEENIQHLQIATGVPRGNGQVERIHRTLIPVLTKLSLDDSTKWYKYVDRLQRILNSAISRSTKWTPFELLVGIKMRNKEDILIKDLLLEEMAKELLEQHEFLRNDAKKNMETLQSENRKTYNRRRKKASLYKEGDLVAIQRTQFGAGLKLRPKFLGPYKVTKVNSKDRYEVEKVGQHQGPNSTTTSADLMKHFYA
ncbi:transposon Tf2-6 polyprotein [Trichonephila clavipes]|nr:transposon Tf2-6 polyprotein [Trichonephila clavipes]